MGLRLMPRLNLAALACTEQLHEILVAHIQQLVKVNSTVGVLPDNGGHHPLNLQKARGESSPPKMFLRVVGRQGLN